MSDYDSTLETNAHISRVRELLYQAVTRIHERAQEHDQSKLSDEEKLLFDKVTGALSGLTYGSRKYKAQLAKLKPALDHHYANNSHHPEHFQNGVRDMTLLDLLEMLADWKAAGERHADGSMARSLKVNKRRFKVPAALQIILENSAKELGWL